MSAVVLSLFPGIDIFGQGFERAGFCVVRGPDLLWGGDIRSFNPPRGIAQGIIGGSPCQDFSSLRRAEPTGEGAEMLAEFCRVVRAAWPEWFVLENVPRVPSVRVEGYDVQRLDVRASEFGCAQHRLRHFQFGSRCGEVIALERGERESVISRAATATESSRPGRRDWPAFCALQGLPPLELPSFTKSARYRAVGNAVALPVACAIAQAVKLRMPWHSCRLCECSCGRRVTGRRASAGPACRKRLERRRSGGDRPRTGHDRRVTTICDGPGGQRRGRVTFLGYSSKWSAAPMSDGMITTAVLRVNHYVDIDGRVVKVDLTPIGPVKVGDIARAAYSAALRRHRIDGKPHDADLRTIESFVMQSIRLRIAAMELAHHVTGRGGLSPAQSHDLARLVLEIAQDIAPYIAQVNQSLPSSSPRPLPALPPPSSGR